MKCYLDDVCVKELVIGKNVIISYGVYFACHGRKQGHNKLVIKDGAYIGMRANITARHDLVIGEGAVIGAGTLVNYSVPDGATCVGVSRKDIGSKGIKVNSNRERRKNEIKIRCSYFNAANMHISSYGSGGC